MNKQLIRELAITGGIYDCIRDPYDQLKNGDPYSSIMPDLERFAKKIILECCAITDEVERADLPVVASKFVKAHFGIEE
jgi:hypothetical protein